MSWLIKRWGKKKYGLWTTISDGYLHEPKKLSKQEILDFISQLWREETENKIAILKKSFPENWFDKDTHRMLSKED